ncbi:hypothetical protein Ancab_016749 [Ancistrocladus abbreviatus]
MVTLSLLLCNTFLVRLQTLYHADKEKADLYILELLTWLHRIINALKHKDHDLKPLPRRSPSQRGMMLHLARKRRPAIHVGRETFKVDLSEEEQRLLERVSSKGEVPGISKSQEFVRSQWKDTKSWASSGSMGRSPFRDLSRRDRSGGVNGLDIPS